jgi:hypothetical protein
LTIAILLQPASKTSFKLFKLMPPIPTIGIDNLLEASRIVSRLQVRAFGFVSEEKMAPKAT